MEKSIKQKNMKTLKTESKKYSSPVCETFACESMTPLCVSGVGASGSSENFGETDYEWQIK